MLSQTAEYALRAVLFLARHDGMPLVKADTIAEALDAPPNYLAKTLSTLAAEGIIEGRRGPHGGYRLAVPASKLTVACVTDPFDGRSDPVMCLLRGRECDRSDPCDAHDRWMGVRAAVRSPLRATSVADLVGQGA